MKVALVTGASRGLGAVISTALAADGWAVAINYSRDGDGARRVAETIATAGGTARAFRFSAIDKAQIEAGVAEIAETLGPIDLIVNNATGPQPAMPIMQQSWQTYIDQLEFFLKGPLELLQAVLPDWRRRKSGRIINIGSEVAELGLANVGHYAAAKGAMLSMTRSWACELAPDGITCNLIAPGWIPVERHADVAQEDIDAYLALTPLAHFGVPQDIADAVVFLASDKAGFITGQKLAVNGGRTLL